MISREEGSTFLCNRSSVQHTKLSPALTWVEKRGQARELCLLKGVLLYVSS